MQHIIISFIEVELTIGSAAFSKVLIENNAKTLLSFDFDIPHVEPFLEEMYAHLHQKEYAKNAKVSWHNDPCQVRTICNKVDQFISFAKCNNNNLVKYVVTCSREERAPGKLVTITLHSPDATMKEFEAPTVPGKPRVVNWSRNDATLQLQWDPPTHGAEHIVQYYAIYYRDPQEVPHIEKLGSATTGQVHLEALNKSGAYTFVIQGECELGFTVESEKSDPVMIMIEPPLLQ